MILFLIVAAGIYSFGWMRVAGMQACVWSLADPIRNSVKSNSELSQSHRGIGWNFLEEQAARQLVGGYIRTGRGDCGTFESMRDGTDYWGNTIRVAVMHPSPEQPPRVRVSSNGPDGAPDTEDDIVVESPTRTQR